MGILVFVCPTTGHEVSTGVEIDRSNYKRLSRTKTAVFVRAVARTIRSPLSGLGWSTRSPKLRMKVDPRSLLRRWFIPKRSSPILEPCRSRGAMLWRGTPLA